MNKIVPAVAAIAIVAAGGWYLAAGQGQTPGMTPFAAEAQESSEAPDLSLVEEMQIGNPDAEVTVVEYASFTCPHCRTFHDSVFDELKANYIDEGKINFVYREVYFDRPGLWASLIARCAGPDRYFPIVDMIYERQSDWLSSSDPATIADNLRKLGVTAGLSPDQVQECLSDADKAQALFASFEQNAAEDDIRSTPSFIINGEQFGNMNYADFSELLDERLSD
ncbi:DsbA family protein [Palleronia sp. LCG004]|uniref:DsbA family protein n=1 Tax=Palleronia sp. LCG004 TaxID=3079304 RepID=UPI00294248C7|nr:DsbA family protein [Palleronia sp. LCG004]WOI56155.1 DsbA family protein [Palleronia sp. LCG004]